MKKISAERVKLMDQVFIHMVSYYIEHKDRRYPCDTLYAAMLEIPRDLAQWLINQIAEIGQDLGLLVAQKHGYGQYSIVNMDRISCLDFSSEGGFENHFQYVEDSTGKQAINININGNNNNVVSGDNNNLKS